MSRPQATCDSNTLISKILPPSQREEYADLTSALTAAGMSTVLDLLFNKDLKADAADLQETVAAVKAFGAIIAVRHIPHADAVLNGKPVACIFGAAYFVDPPLGRRAAGQSAQADLPGEEGRGW